MSVKRINSCLTLNGRDFPIWPHLLIISEARGICSMLWRTEIPISYGKLQRKEWRYITHRKNDYSHTSNPSNNCEARDKELKCKLCANGANLKLIFSSHGLGYQSLGHLSRHIPPRNVDNSEGMSSLVKSVWFIREFRHAGPPDRPRTWHPSGRVMLSLFFTILSFTWDLSTKSAYDKCTHTSCSVAGDKQHAETSLENKTSFLWDTPEFHNLLNAESEKTAFQNYPQNVHPKTIWSKSANVVIKCMRHNIYLPHDRCGHEIGESRLKFHHLSVKIPFHLKRSL